MEINPRKKNDLSPKSVYPTTGWLNQSHFSLLANDFEKINSVKITSEYNADEISRCILIEPFLLGTTSQNFSMAENRSGGVSFSLKPIPLVRSGAFSIKL